MTGTSKARSRPNDVIIAETGTSSMGLACARLPKGAESHNQTLWGAIGWAAQEVQGPRPSPTTNAAAWNYAELPHALGCEGRPVATGERINIFLVKCVVRRPRKSSSASSEGQLPAIQAASSPGSGRTRPPSIAKLAGLLSKTTSTRSARTFVTRVTAAAISVASCVTSVLG